MATTRTTGSMRVPVSTIVTLATQGDVDGTVDNTQAYDITGADRVILIQSNDDAGGSGGAGIDVVEISHDGGATWTADDLTVYACSENDTTGTLAVGGVLNAAGVEPTYHTVFKCGPYEGQTAIRIGRLTSTITSMATYDKSLTAGTTWTTHAPSVYMFTIGHTSGAPTALA